MRQSCFECFAEFSLPMLGPPQETVECEACNRVWSVEWVKAPFGGRSLVMPKFTVINDGEDHWQPLAAIAVSIARPTEPAGAAA